MIEHRQMKACEPRDLLDRVTDICLFEGHALELSPKVLDLAWRNYFGTAHVYVPEKEQTGPLHAQTGSLKQQTGPLAEELAEPLQL